VPDAVPACLRFIQPLMTDHFKQCTVYSLVSAGAGRNIVRKETAGERGERGQVHKQDGVPCSTEHHTRPTAPQLSVGVPSSSLITRLSKVGLKLYCLPSYHSLFAFTPCVTVLNLAGLHPISAFMKWALARVIPDWGGGFCFVGSRQ
jgi:hypothetical protein